MTIRRIPERITQGEPFPVRSLSATLTAADVMSPRVTSVSKRTPLREVVELLLGKLYRAVPVVEDGAPVGIITNTDLVERGGLDLRLDLVAALPGAERSGLLERLARSERVAAEVMTPDPVTVGWRTPLRQVAELMARRRLKRLPVVDGHGVLVGMVSRLDLLRTASRGPEREEAASREPPFPGDVALGRVMQRDVPTVFPESPLSQVLLAVTSTRLHRALVVDHQQRVVGVISDAEMLERLTPALRPGVIRSLVSRLPFAHQDPADRASGEHARARCAADLLDPLVATAREDTLLGEATATMLRGAQKVLAVTDASGRLVGMVDRADLLRGLLT